MLSIPGVLGSVFKALVSILPWLILKWKNVKQSKIKYNQLEAASKPRLGRDALVDQLRRGGL